MAARKSSSKAKAEVFNLSKSVMATPKGSAKWAYLAKPSEFEKYTITVFFGVDEAKALNTAVVNAYKAWCKEEGTAPKKLTFVKKADAKMAERAGVEEGTFYVAFDKRDGENAKPVQVVDARKETVDSGDVWGGDIVKVSFMPCFWQNSTGNGLKGYLRAVQIIEAGERSGGATSVFDVEEDIEDEELGDEAEETEESEDAGEEALFDDSDIPF